MADQVRMAFAGGGSITIQAEATAAVPVAGGRGEMGRGEAGRGPVDNATQQVTKTFEDSLSGLSKIADSLQLALRSAISPPDTVTVNFGISFSASGDIVLMKASGGASLDISMTWKRS